MSQSKNASELIASSKRKYSLARARLRREHNELTLISLHGSLEDGLRAHLHLHNSPAANGDWLTMFEALHADMDKPLTHDEGDMLWRMHRLYTTIAEGDTVTISRETLIGFQKAAARVLIRYGVLVVAPDDQAVRPLPGDPSPWHWRIGTVWRRHRSTLMPVLAILIIFLIGAASTIAININHQPVLSVIRPVLSTTRTPTNPPGDEPPGTPSRLSVAPDQLAPGRTAFVKAGVTNGLAMRDEPSDDEEVPIKFYLAANSAVRIISGPIEADGYTWWKVRAANQEGWCAGEYLEVR